MKPPLALALCAMADPVAEGEGHGSASRLPRKLWPALANRASHSRSPAVSASLLSSTSNDGDQPTPIAPVFCPRGETPCRKETGALSVWIPYRGR